MDGFVRKKNNVRLYVSLEKRMNQLLSAGWKDLLPIIRDSQNHFAYRK